jgi:hypothetical protein
LLLTDTCIDCYRHKYVRIKMWADTKITIISI